MSDFSKLPSVDHLLGLPEVKDLIILYGRPLTLEAIRFNLQELREQNPEDPTIYEDESIVNQVSSTLIEIVAPTLCSVINASGVILHTNLGRSPLSTDTLEAIRKVSLGYSTLEYDLKGGERGSRQVHVESMLQYITGAEAAMVVNNNAAAVLLILTVLAKEESVVIARSQLVEIGGGFRIPEVMKQSGARLVEVGTTNRVHLSDYQQALDESPKLFLRVHRSNFRITGFTSEPLLKDIVNVCHEAGLNFVDDLGSGTLIETKQFGLEHEQMVQESLEAGSDLVCFSGDKLLGGPQAGVIVGRSKLIEKLKSHQLSRAIRADKLCLAALSATLLHYLKDETVEKIPVWKMISASIEDIKARAEKWFELINQENITCEIISGESTVGGGSLPGETLPTYLLALNVPNPNKVLSDLRKVTVPVIGRIQNNLVVFDPRTVLPAQDQDLISGILKAIV